jgi:hypothetical protein
MIIFLALQARGQEQNVYTFVIRKVLKDTAAIKKPATTSPIYGRGMADLQRYVIKHHIKGGDNAHIYHLDIDSVGNVVKCYRILGLDEGINDTTYIKTGLTMSCMWLRRMKWHPAVVNGQPVSQTIELTVSRRDIITYRTIASGTGIEFPLYSF